MHGNRYGNGWGVADHTLLPLELPSRSSRLPSLTEPPHDRGPGGKKLLPYLTNILFESIDSQHPDASRRPSGDRWVSVWSNAKDGIYSDIQST